MAEYVERSAILKKQTTMTEYDEGGWAAEAKVVRVEDIEKAPAADVVEVVRCERCRFGRNPLPDHGIRQCAKTLMFHPADWYCPNGDRMVSKDVSHLSPEAQGLYHALMNRMDGED